MTPVRRVATLVAAAGLLALLGIAGCADDERSAPGSTTTSKATGSTTTSSIEGADGSSSSDDGSDQANGTGADGEGGSSGTSPDGDASTTVPAGRSTTTVRGGSASTTAKGSSSGGSSGGSAGGSTGDGGATGGSGAGDGSTTTEPPHEHGSQPTIIAPPLPTNPGDTKDCDDFSSYADANSWFQYYRPAYGDVANLDPDRDLVPCEELPGAPS